VCACVCGGKSPAAQPRLLSFLWFVIRPVGHDVDDRPYCYDSASKEWRRSARTKFDYSDPLNDVSGPSDGIDRHDCVAIDVNFDGYVDVVCVVGADKGLGEGYTELYLTNPSDGSLVKAPANHGLHQYPTMRTRIVRRLASAAYSGTQQLLFVGTTGGPRPDGRPNQHRVFRQLWTRTPPYFEELTAEFMAGIATSSTTTTTTTTTAEYPWTGQDFPVRCATVVESDRYVLGNDGEEGHDSLILCTNDVAKIYWQRPSGMFVDVQLPLLDSTRRWRNARVGTVTRNRSIDGESRPDLVVVRDGRGEDSSSSYLEIFKGTDESPFFDFANPYYTLKLPYTAPDLEILNVNGDEYSDIYVVQTNTREGYCSIKPSDGLWEWWGDNGSKTKRYPDASFVPPLDTAPDVVLVGGPAGTSGGVTFTKVEMSHQGRGCGGMVEKFGNDRTLMLVEGDFFHPGFSYSLEWN